VNIPSSVDVQKYALEFQGLALAEFRRRQVRPGLHVIPHELEKSAHQRHELFQFTILVNGMFEIGPRSNA
jgi:hypothetical protein